LKNKSRNNQGSLLLNPRDQAKVVESMERLSKADMSKGTHLLDPKEQLELVEA
jgi:hypothetical protein